MGIYIKDRRVNNIYVHSRPIIAVYTKGRKIWPDIIPSEIPDIILSCYYNGYWVDEYPWTDDTSWTD